MQTLEYLGFIPLLMFGLGLADLLSQWKRLFDPKEWYLPYTIFTVILTELAVYNVYTYFNLLAQLPGKSYYIYLLYLLPPFLFLLTTSAFTPEKEADTKEHFVKRMPIFFTLLGVFILSHFIFNYQESIYIHIARLLIVAILIMVGFTRKMWLVYFIALIWLVSFMFRGKLDSNSAFKDDPNLDQKGKGVVFQGIIEHIDGNKIPTNNIAKASLFRMKNEVLKRF